MTRYVCLFILAAAMASAQQPPAEPKPTAPATPAPDIHLYRISANLTTGVMISKQTRVTAEDGTTSKADDFSKANLYVGLNLTRAWIQKKRFHLENLFDARLTSIAVQSSADKKEENLDNFLLASRKAAQLQFGVFAPIVAPIESVAKEADAPNGTRGFYRHAFYIAPIAKAGIQTLTEGEQSNESLKLGADDVYNFWAIGGRIGVLKRWYKTTCDEDPDPDLGSESWLHFDFMRGRYENFTIPSEFKPEAGESKDLRPGNRALRYAFEGRLRLPFSPYTFVGFDANLGPGRDDVRFIFGANLQLSDLMSALNKK